MLLNITPSGNEFQRKMLLEHSSKIRTIFLIVLLLIPLSIFIGNYYAKPKADETNNSYMRNVAMILVENGENSVSQGTAFLVSNQSGVANGYLFTARHVIDHTQSKKVALMFPYITNENDEPLVTTASIVWTTDVAFDGSDVNTLRYDVALLKLDDLSVLPEDVSGFMIGTEAQVKQNISIYGFPSSEGYAVDGQIANTSFNGIEDLFTLSFQIDGGASGAPIYDESTGEALGIAIASATHTDLQNICISLKRALELMDQAGIKGLLSE
jgi:S1-C subfamily serine protease